MTWSMFAVGRRGGRRPARGEFAKAVAVVIEKSGSVDTGLDAGGLMCSACCREMERISGISVFHDWSPEEFETAHRRISTLPDEEPDDPADLWAYWSAREFIRVCAENNLSAFYG